MSEYYSAARNVSLERTRQISHGHAHDSHPFASLLPAPLVINHRGPTKQNTTPSSRSPSPIPASPRRAAPSSSSSSHPAEHSPAASVSCASAAAGRGRGAAVGVGRGRAVMEDLGIEAKEAAVREVAKLLPLPELLSSIASIKSDYLARQQVMWSLPRNPIRAKRSGISEVFGW